MALWLHFGRKMTGLHAGLLELWLSARVRGFEVAAVRRILHLDRIRHNGNEMRTQVLQTWTAMMYKSLVKTI